MSEAVYVPTAFGKKRPRTRVSPLPVRLESIDAMKSGAAKASNGVTAPGGAMSRGQPSGQSERDVPDREPQHEHARRRVGEQRVAERDPARLEEADEQEGHEQGGREDLQEEGVRGDVLVPLEDRGDQVRRDQRRGGDREVFEGDADIGLVESGADEGAGEKERDRDDDPGDPAQEERGADHRSALAVRAGERQAPRDGVRQPEGAERREEPRQRERPGEIAPVVGGDPRTITTRAMKLRKTNRSVATRRKRVPFVTVDSPSRMRTVEGESTFLPWVRGRRRTVKRHRSGSTVL